MMVDDFSRTKAIVEVNSILFCCALGAQANTDFYHFLTGSSDVN